MKAVLSVESLYSHFTDDKWLLGSDNKEEKELGIENQSDLKV